MKLKINPSLILTIVGSAGVVATAITFARASVKAEKFIEENDISKDEKNSQRSLLRLMRQLSL